MRTLLEFPHSHYCEKARWALDYKGIPYRRKALFPGLHRFQLRRLPASSVPVLIDGGDWVQGSSEILDALDRRYPERPLLPDGPRERQACAEWEAFLDREIGEHIRRLCYFHLLGRPDLVGYFFCYGQSTLWPLAFRVAYPFLRPKLVEAYDIRAEGAARSAAALRAALDRLGEALKGRSFLVGERLTRADITAASMLCFFAEPAEHPVAWPTLPAAADAALAPFRSEPAVEWTRQLYRRYRRPARSA